MVSEVQSDWKPRDWLAPFGESGHADRGLRLQTLVRLRWLAVIGQTGAIAWVYFLLSFPLPLGACLAVIALSAWLNVFLSLRWRTSIRLNERYAAACLVMT